MHILIVSHGYPTKSDPQWGCFEKDQAEALVKLGHKVTVMATDGRFRMYYRKMGVNHIQDGSISAYVFFLFPLRLLLWWPIKDRFREWMTLSLFKHVVRIEGTPDVIYAHYMHNMAALRSVKKQYNIPIVGIEHWSELNRAKMSSEVSCLGKIAYRTVDLLLAVSPHLQHQIKKHFGVDSEVLYDMLNDLFLQEPLPERSSHKPFRYIAVGSLNKWKAYDVLIEAFSHIEDNNAELSIIGDGYERLALMQMTERLNVGNRVHFLGRMDKVSIIEKLKEADAFVLPSRGETFGVAYVEALAMGLPVIATRCGGPESFMTEKCGLLVDVDDVKGLIEAMNRMQESIHEYDPYAIREYIRQKFSGSEIAGRIEMFLKQTIGGG